MPTNRWIVFGHHFAAIAGPGPLIGPTLAAQFGYLPGTLWILVGAVLGGCVQDISSCSARFAATARSPRPDGARRDRPVGGAAALVGVLCDHDHPDRRARPRRRQRDGGTARGRTSTVLATIPIALAGRASTCATCARAACSRRPRSASCCCSLAVFGGGWIDHHPTLRALVRPRRARRSRWFVIVYGFVGSGAAGVAAARAARLPVDVHQDRHRRRCSRSRSCMLQPEIQMPALTQFIDGTGPIFGGNAVPVRVHHASPAARSRASTRWSSSGTTPKLIARETRRPHDRLRRDGAGVLRRDHGAGRRLRARPRRLLRDQHRRPASWARDPATAAATISALGLPRRRPAQMQDAGARAWASTTLFGAHGRRAVARRRHGAHLLARVRRRRCSRSGTTSRSCSRRCSS